MNPYFTMVKSYAFVCLKQKLTKSIPVESIAVCVSIRVSVLLTQIGFIKIKLPLCEIDLHFLYWAKSHVF